MMMNDDDDEDDEGEDDDDKEEDEYDDVLSWPQIGRWPLLEISSATSSPPSVQWLFHFVSTSFPR